jgi:hypothetical protein
MGRFIRRLVATLSTALALITVSAGPAGAVTRLDGVQLRHLPAGLGRSSDFTYHYQRVDFVARVWESGSDSKGWRVDLDVQVMRGRRLRSPRALHDWFIAYEQRPANEVHYRPVRIRGHRGWITRDEVFWLVRPKLAVAITIDRTRWSRRALLRTARGVRAPRR